GNFPLNSGIDEYYMDWLEDQIASAAVAACDGRRPASLREVEFPVPAGLKQEIPGRFPTTADDRSKPTAIDDKVRVLQARDGTGTEIADEVAARLGNAMAVPIGSVGGRRTAFCVPLENNLFRALAQAGIFGERQTYTSTPTGGCEPAGRAGQDVKTSVAVVD